MSSLRLIVNGVISRGVTAAEIDENGHLIFTLSGSSGTVDLGQVVGDKGDTGDAGFSPTVAISDITGGHRVTVTDANGAHAFDVFNGADGVSIKGDKGDKGDTGNTGPAGTPGTDGFSPTVELQTITGGTRVIITDANGEKGFDVMSGDDGIPSALLGDTANYTIVCAKETNYADGTAPSVEWYLIESPAGEFYITKDFHSAKYLFTADYNPFHYKYAVLKSGDIIAVYRTERSSVGGSDGNRQNPFVYLASEGWGIKHTVDFGSALKPSGWLENVGFCSMPSGDAMFCEYTRPSVVTANCWKIHGDPTLASSWTVKKSFTLSGLPSEGFKHCHTVCLDYYTGVYYLTTGDDDVGAQVWYSLDDGETWTLAREPSEKYCRVLNMIFTKDYIYWGSDSSKAISHYLFRAARGSNGVIDYSTVTELEDLYVSGVATYGLVYLEGYNAIVLLDKADTAATSIPFRIYDIDAGTLYTMGTLETADGTAQQIGFRTEYSEFLPNGNYVLCGFGKRLSMATYRNFIKGLGNEGDPDGWEGNVNNLRIEIYKKTDGYGYRLKTAFMPHFGASGANGEDLHKDLFVDTASGSAAVITDGADNIPVKSLIAQIEPVQSGSGTPSPSNVRPISGWTEATVGRAESIASVATGDETVISFGEAGTVYGGTLDVTNGLLTVDRVAMTFDGTEEWSQPAGGANNPNGSAFRCDAPYALKTFANAAAFANVYAASNLFAKASNTLNVGSEAVNVFWWNLAGTTVSVIYGQPQNGTTLAQFKAFLGENPLTICGKLQTSVNYQLTPAEIKTLLGSNYIWADTGDVAVTYYADSTLHLEKKLAEMRVYISAQIGDTIGGEY